MTKLILKMIAIFMVLPALGGTLIVNNRSITKSCGDNKIIFTGEIQNGDAIKLEKIIGELKRKYGSSDCANGWLAIIFDSDGGNVYEAISIGKILRNNKIHAIVPMRSQCNSACVLAFAGAIRKDSYGPIGIHRPYFAKMDANLSINQIKAERDKINKAILEYFNQIDIPPSLLDLMLSIPPDKMKILNEDEVQLYRLTGVDANHDEFEVARMAKRYAITSSEYRAKNTQYSELCKKNGMIDFDCYDSKMLNISVSELKKRFAKADKECEKTPSDECYMKFLRR
jgi:hypothetical protein